MELGMEIAWWVSGVASVFVYFGLQDLWDMVRPIL